MKRDDGFGDKVAYMIFVMREMWENRKGVRIRPFDGLGRMSSHHSKGCSWRRKVQEIEEMAI